MIETLTDNNAILLLYLAGELPDADRREVERRLAADPNLAEQLAELKGIHQQIATQFAKLEQREENRPSPENAIEKAVAAVEGWRFGPRLVMPEPAPQRYRLWAWAAPAALAASVLVAALIWVEHRPATSDPLAIHTAPPTSATSPDDTDSDTNLALLQQSFSTGFEQPQRRMVPDIRPEASARDDLSDYLLKTEVGPQ